MVDSEDKGAGGVALREDEGAVASGERPSFLPEKFWDVENGQPRLDALARSYGELEKRMSSMVRLPEENAGDEERAAFHRKLGVPENAESYEVVIEGKKVASDPEVDGRLHRAGFTREQTQLVYQLAYEKLAPLVQDAAAHLEGERATERLQRHFGGEESWGTAARQIAEWGRRTLPLDAYDALAATYEGVVAMERMMRGQEPQMLRGAGGEGPLNEEALRKLIASPAYWRDRDPETLRRVSDGYRALYGER